MRFTCGAHEMFRIRITHQGIGLPVLDGPRCGHPQGGEADARHDVPGVALLRDQSLSSMLVIELSFQAGSVHVR